MSSQIKSPGAELNLLMGAIGFPETAAEISGAALDRVIQNDLGIASSLLDAFSELPTLELIGVLKQEKIGDPGFFPKPKDALSHARELSGSSYNNREQCYNSRTISGLIKRCLGAHRSAFRDHGATSRDQNPVINSVLKQLNEWIKISRTQSQLAETIGKSESTPEANGASRLSSILNDPNLCFEEKLFLFLVAFMEKKQHEIEKKTAELDRHRKLQQEIEDINKMFLLIDSTLKSMNDLVEQDQIAAIRG